MLEDPAGGCREIRFQARLTLEPAAEMALEDYARVMTRARHAEVLRAEPLPSGYDSAPITGVHLCDPQAPCDGPPADDIESFAREMAVAPEPNGLGWS